MDVVVGAGVVLVVGAGVVDVVVGAGVVLVVGAGVVDVVVGAGVVLVVRGSGARRRLRCVDVRTAVDHETANPTALR